VAATGEGQLDEGARPLATAQGHSSRPAAGRSELARRPGEKVASQGMGLAASRVQPPASPDLVP